MPFPSHGKKKCAGITPPVSSMNILYVEAEIERSRVCSQAAKSVELIQPSQAVSGPVAIIVMTLVTSFPSLSGTFSTSVFTPSHEISPEWNLSAATALRAILRSALSLATINLFVVAPVASTNPAICVIA